MIRLAPSTEALTGAERFGLELLVDLARLVPVDDPAADVVALDVITEGNGAGSLVSLLAKRWLIEPGDGVVRVPRETLRAVTEIAGAAVEQRSGARDRYGRIPPAANPLVAAGLERGAVVSRAGVRLREAAVAAAGRRPVRVLAPWPEGKRWAMAMTHDLDVAALWPAFTALRLVELARKGRLRYALATLGAAAGALAGAPVRRAAESLLDREAERGVRCTWFIICGTPTFATMRAGDVTYRPDAQPASGIIAEAARRGQEIALHGSFVTSERPAEFDGQRARLERLVGRPVAGVRQHFLRVIPGRTHREMERAKLGFDSSCGFPDRNGFRLGVADVLPAWDAEQGRALGIAEAPPCWMDRALSKYRGVEDPRAWVADALALAEECRAADGLWVGVWHPNLVAALGYPGAPEAYDELLRGLLAADPYVATLGELVGWRRARRLARVAAVAPDGRVKLASGGEFSDSLVLEEPAR